MQSNLVWQRYLIIKRILLGLNVFLNLNLVDPWFKLLHRILNNKVVSFFPKTTFIEYVRVLYKKISVKINSLFTCNIVFLCRTNFKGLFKLIDYFSKQNFVLRHWTKVVALYFDILVSEWLGWGLFHHRLKF